MILWLTLALACFLPASALTLTAPENRIWEISSTGYDAPTSEVTDLGTRTETSTSDYDSAPIHRAATEEIPTEANRPLFGPNAEFKAADETDATLVQGEFTTYQDFVDRSVVGDNLEGHELWQQANLEEMGLSTTRLSTPASQMNPVIVLDKDTHDMVDVVQGLFDARTMTPVENITLNAQILRALNVTSPEVIDAAEQAALEHAGDYGY
jgi:hypothetical protein